MVGKLLISRYLVVVFTYRSKRRRTCCWRAKCSMYLSCSTRLRSDSTWRSRASSSRCTSGWLPARARSPAARPSYDRTRHMCSHAATRAATRAATPRRHAAPPQPRATARLPRTALHKSSYKCSYSGTDNKCARPVRQTVTVNTSAVHLYLCWVDECIGLLFSRGIKTSHTTDWFIIK